MTTDVDSTVDLLVTEDSFAIQTEAQRADLLSSPDVQAIVNDAGRTDLLLTPAEDTVFAVTERVDVVQFGTGPQGPPGPTGAHSVTFEYDQGLPAAVWNINHALGKFPSVTVVDSTGRTVEGQIQYVDANNVQLTFAGGFAGKAYLN